MKVLFLTDNFPPEYNAPATRTFEHCRQWVKQGAEVTVITCAPNFPKGKVFDGYKNSWRQTEIIEGIRVIRVWSFISPNAGFFKRTLDFISFAITSFIAGLGQKCDIIVATSPQFFTAISGCALGFFKRKKWVMEVRDLWPESIKAVEAVNSSWIISILEKIELFLYKSAHKIIVVTDSFKKNLIDRGIDENKIFVIKNGVDLSIYTSQSRNPELYERFKLDKKFVIGYVGTHGLAHSLEFIIKSIHTLNDTSFHFLFIGDGAEKKNIVAKAQELNLSNVTFIDPVKKSEIPDYLSLLDASLVPLKKSSTFESVIPSKVFEAVAMDIPILLGVDGETRLLIEQYNAGLYFEPENETEFIRQLIQIRKEVSGVHRFKEGCRKMAQDFDRKNLANKMLTILSN